MSGINFVVQVDDQPSYTTNDSGRLYAYMLGVLIGSGTPGVEAHVTVDSTTREFVHHRQGRTLSLKDGRTLRLSVRQPEAGVRWM